MSAQDAIEPASPSKSDSAHFSNCTHDNASAQHSTSSPVPPITGIRPKSPQVNFHPQSPQIRIKNQPANLNCTCTHHGHRNILHQHYHRYPVSSGSGTGTNPNHPNHRHSAHVNHHNAQGNDSTQRFYMRQQSMCDCGNSSAPEQSNRSSRVMSGDEINQSEREDNNRRCCQRLNK